MIARRTDVVWSITHSECCLRRDKKIVPTALHSFPEDFFRKAARIHIGGIKQIDSRVKTQGDKSFRFVDFDLTPGAEEFVPSTKSTRSETKCRNL